MEFRNIVNSALKSKEEIRFEEEKEYTEQLQNVAEYIYDQIKTEIINKAASGEYSNGEISGIFKIYFLDFEEVNNDVVLPYAYQCFLTGRSYRECSQHMGFWGFRYVHNLTVSINHVERVEELFNVIKRISANDRISISSPFLYATMIKYTKTTQKLISESKIPITNNKLQHTLRFVTNHHKHGYSGYDTGTRGFIDLAVDYTYLV